MTNNATRTIRAELRQQPSKGSSRRLRKSGFVPAIVYARGRNLAIAIDSKTLPSGHPGGEILTLEVAGQPNSQVLMREVQVDPLTGAPIHMDLQAVEAEDVVSINLPIKLGATTREQEKIGFLKSMTKSILVKGKVKDLPKLLEVDISGLRGAQTLLVKDLQVPPTLKVIAAPGKAVAQLVET